MSGRPPRDPERGLKAWAAAAIRFYQAALRPMNPWGCKFYPSCSEYALAAIQQYGWARGLGLGWRRLVRCRPGVRGGFDPLPEPPERLL